MLTGRVFDALNAWYSLAVAALPSGFVVLDGPGVSVQTPMDFLACGVDDLTSESLNLAADGTSTWAALGAQAREEAFAIYSTLVAWDGTADIPAMRTRVQTNIALLETAVRTTAGVTLNGALGATGWCGLGVTRVQQIQTTSGGAVHVQLVLSCTTRI